MLIRRVNIHSSTLLTTGVSVRRTKERDDGWAKLYSLSSPAFQLFPAELLKLRPQSACGGNHYIIVDLLSCSKEQAAEIYNVRRYIITCQPGVSYETTAKTVWHGVQCNTIIIIIIIITISSSTNTNKEYSYILKAKDNPSLLMATLFPMYKTRYKYKITFHHVHVGGVVGGEGDGSKQEEKEIRVSYQDVYLITFNRTNGSTPEQQMRIYNRTKAFEEQLEKLIEEIRYDKEMIIQKEQKEEEK